jgi:hypothetical protein
MSSTGKGSNNKRQRLEEGQEEEDTSDAVDVKLSEELRELMGGRKYIKEEELTRAVLLEWAKRLGAVKQVNLISITVQSMGGTETEVTLDYSANTVRSLKRNIQDSQGISTFTQHLFLVSKSGDNAEASVDAKQEPLKDDALLSDDSCVALCIDAVEENCWDSSSPLITVSTAFVVCRFVNLIGSGLVFRTSCLSSAARATALQPR